MTTSSMERLKTECTQAFIRLTFPSATDFRRAEITEIAIDAMALFSGLEGYDRERRIDSVITIIGERLTQEEEEPFRRLLPEIVGLSRRVAELLIQNVRGNTQALSESRALPLAASTSGCSGGSSWTVAGAAAAPRAGSSDSCVGQARVDAFSRETLCAAAVPRAGRVNLAGAASGLDSSLKRECEVLLKGTERVYGLIPEKNMDLFTSAQPAFFVFEGDVYAIWYNPTLCLTGIQEAGRFHSRSPDGKINISAAEVRLNGQACEVLPDQQSRLLRVALEKLNSINTFDSLVSAMDATNAVMDLTNPLPGVGSPMVATPSLSVLDSRYGTPVPPVRIGAGETRCLNFRDCSRGISSAIILKDNVYEVEDSSMGSRTRALLMTLDDFKTLRSICHEGAFGSCFFELNACDLASYGLVGLPGKKYKILTKIPADLMHVQSWKVDRSQPFSVENVGEYTLVADMYPDELSEANQAIIRGLVHRRGKKVRSDCSRIPASEFRSVHSIKFETDTIEIPGISTAFFFGNFNSPKPEEYGKIKKLLNTLARRNIGAYLCNSSHHMIIIGAYEGEALTAKGLAEKLESHNTEAIFECAFRDAAIPEFKENVNAWIALYKERFLTAS